MAAENPPTYRQDIEFLRQFTTVEELTEGEQARVAVCPEYQGRVMTSTVGGLDGPSLGWVNREFIQTYIAGSKKSDTTFNNFGGEDRFWLSPEAGPFSLYFQPGKPQILSQWQTPPGLNEGAFDLSREKSAPFLRLTRALQLRNYFNTPLAFKVVRTVRMLSVPQCSALCGPQLGELLVQPGVRYVGFETDNTVTNAGKDLHEATGLVSIWCLGQFRPGPHTWVIVPYREAPLPHEPIVTSSYFFNPPADRLKILDGVVLFKADAQFRSKIGISQARALPWIASLDLDAQVLTLVIFSVPADPTKHAYINNLWNLPQVNPYTGDVVNSYNDGPTEPGAESLGGFYELETLSPTRALKQGESLGHVHRTIHVQAEPALLDRILAALPHGPDPEAVHRAIGK
ncbi:MAG: hypothetical protein K1X74_02305 [Pirellulales bacterium]|nr:hypothetical protein [Pirellulales bacterium]